MPKINLFTRLLALFGAFLAWIPFLVFVTTSIIHVFTVKSISLQIHFSYLLSASALIGGGLLFWAAVRSCLWLDHILGLEAISFILIAAVIGLAIIGRFIFLGDTIVYLLELLSFVFLITFLFATFTLGTYGIRILRYSNRPLLLPNHADPKGLQDL